MSGQAAGWGVKDYDVFYFDDRDLSWDTEDAVIRCVGALAGDLGISVETRNQARVHLWYENRFGAGYPKLASARDGYRQKPARSVRMLTTLQVVLPRPEKSQEP